MKIEKLNENKIKITFTIDDLEEKNIDLYSFMHNTPETQELFWDILNKAEKECGFNVDNSMICVEASTLGGGNFVLIVTKTNEKPMIHSQSLSNKKLKLKRKNIPVIKQENIYQFASFDDLCEYTKTINLRGIKQNSLYSMNGFYYLKCNLNTNSIIEFATVINDSDLFEAKLNEYGNLIIEKRALQTIKKYFSK